MDPRYKSPTANVDIELEQDFRDIELFTNVLKWLMWIGAAFSAFAAISALVQFNMISASYTNETPTEGIARIALASAFNSLYFFGTAIVFGRWIVLAHRNLPGLGVRYIEVTPGWAVGWFFIPIVNLWFPYRGMRFLWRASHSAQRPELQDSTWVLPTWWTIWLAFNFIPLIVSAETRRSYFGDALAALTYSEVATRLAGFALYIVASFLVVRIWRAQRTQHENPGEFDPAPGFADS